MIVDRDSWFLGEEKIFGKERETLAENCLRSNAKLFMTYLVIIEMDCLETLSFISVGGSLPLSFIPSSDRNPIRRPKTLLPHSPLTLRLGDEEAW